MNYTTKVFVKHFRYTDNGDGSLSMYRHRRGKHEYVYFYPETKGGKTEVTIQVFDEHNDPVIKFVGVANCSLKDNFCYKLGREIAFGRALKQLDQWRDNNVVFFIHDNN
jgi:hypothetical protein